MGMKHAQNLHKVFSMLLPDNVSYNVRTFDTTLSSAQLANFRLQHPLSESEHRSIQHAVPKREIEYRMGRSMVKALLQIDQLNTQTFLYKKKNGAPNWPRGFVGSISHSGSNCIVALAKTKQYSGIGIDIECGHFNADLESYIVESSELSLCPDSLSYEASLQMIFCCKEAIFKSLEKYLVERIDFKDVLVQFLKPIDPNIFEFNTQFTRPISGLETFNSKRLNGRVFTDETLALSVVTL